MIPAMLLGSLSIASPASAALVPTPTMEASVVYWTNVQRAKAHCAPLRVDSRLTQAARFHSRWMATTGRFSHTGFKNTNFVTREAMAGYHAPVAENIAWGYTMGPTTVNAWMASPGHRANMLNCRAKAVGVGVAYSKSGKPYFTQDFGAS